MDYNLLDKVTHSWEVLNDVTRMQSELFKATMIPAGVTTYHGFPKIDGIAEKVIRPPCRLIMGGSSVSESSTSGFLSHLPLDMRDHELDLLRDWQDKWAKGCDVGSQGTSSNGHEVLGQMNPNLAVPVLALVDTAITLIT
jgi:hypothetical protein